MSRDYIQFIENIKRKTGIDLSLYKEAQMKRRLTSLYEKRGFTNFLDFFRAFASDEKLYDEFLDRITINVSEFYRNANRWSIFEEKVLPKILNGRSRLKIWSAACSTGEEPYTIAMILSKYLPLSRFSILATDLDENVIRRAKVGVYPERSLMEVPEEIKRKYFSKDRAYYKLSDEIKSAVNFKKHNLLSDQFENNFDLIVCRNVLIYFTEEAKDHLYQKFSNALQTGGIFFVGSTEQIFTPHKYGFDSEDTFFYRKV
ncbi:protein-glutamate O-methyltransferase CheR [Cytobacillus sp. IB215665]|uniref:CheR family methyltransferase n=1 Tax=Cytobacillus sp. IB215665 TaxID=3097357 RepID=UPI002A0AD5B5|nr:protein-glutamate O-methyltransferase CheR [Cytobacillus sp. IB215665]MDX8364853.1 protein-glutamate O-methyltransferase CheR [Cytobacillus sp. IB215665]